MTKLTQGTAQKVINDYINMFGLDPKQRKQMKDLGDKLSSHITPDDCSVSKEKLTPMRLAND